MLYNTILGARPIRPDGVSFYYADYNMDAKKHYYEREVALLFGNVSAIHGGLWHQFVFPRAKVSMSTSTFRRE